MTPDTGLDTMELCVLQIPGYVPLLAGTVSAS